MVSHTRDNHSWTTLVETEIVTQLQEDLVQKDN